MLRKVSGIHSVPKVCLLIVSAALDMLNGAGNIHGGCSAFLVDV